MVALSVCVVVMRVMHGTRSMEPGCGSRLVRGVELYRPFHTVWCWSHGCTDGDGYAVHT